MGQMGNRPPFSPLDQDPVYIRLMNQNIDPSMPTIFAQFDLDNVFVDALEVARIAQVSLKSIERIEDASNGYQQGSIGFYTNEDAFAFTEVYLGVPEDANEVGEYLGFDCAPGA
jgi:hypothetical protein